MFAKSFALLRSDGKQVIDVPWIDLGGTALLGRGPVGGVEDGRVSLNAYLTFAQRRPVRDDQLLPGPDYYAGSWLSDGERAFQVAGAWQGGDADDERNFVKFTEDVPAVDLQHVFADRTVSIWQYGVGDRLEIARVEAMLSGASTE